MAKKKFEQDLRDAGLRKKRARKVAKAADRGRSGDRGARQLVEEQAAALRDSISAVVRHAKPPKRTVQKQTAGKRSTARKRSSAPRSTSKSRARKATSK